MPIDMQVIEKWKNLGGYLMMDEVRPYDTPDCTEQILGPQEKLEVKFYPELSVPVPWSQRIPQILNREEAWKKVTDHLGCTVHGKIWFVDSEGIDGNIENEEESQKTLEELKVFDDQMWDESSYMGSFFFPPDQGGVEIGLYTHIPTGTKYCGCASTGSGSYKYMMF